MRPPGICTRRLPHICTVNGPCNGFPKTVGIEKNIQTHLETLQCDQKVVDPAGFIYWKRGKNISVTFCRLEKPRDKRDVRQIGMVRDGAYGTSRKPADNYFRKADGYGISKTLILNAELFGFDVVCFFLLGHESWISVKNILQVGVEVCEGNFETQLVISPHFLTPTREEALAI